MSKLHSSEYFGNQRNFWWNIDFIELMSKRLNFSERYKILDVGCGIGHWGQLLAQFFPCNFKLIGIDKEKKWIDEAAKRSETFGFSNCTYQEGLAESLDFENNSFDMVTCQTLLIHVQHPEIVINEMCRVLKPDGILVLVEPNNLARNFILGNRRFHNNIDDLLLITKFQFICEKGKISLGKGDNSLGDILPGILSKAGLIQISTYLSDKAFSFIPPYGSETEKALLEQSNDWINREFWIWDKEETYSYFLAGGGVLTDFDYFWSKAMENQKKLNKSIQEEEYINAGGNVNYIISGVKPHLR